MNETRILVFGAAGSGKTSLCNELSGLDMPVRDSARGVTFESFTFPEFVINDEKFFITDTVGLNESNKGNVDAATSAVKLIELLKNSDKGFNLLIHVMRGPRITKNHYDDYQLFVEKIASGKIPCILVVTGCENRDPMSSWVSDNQSEFTQQGFNYQEILATCFASGGRLESIYKDLRLESSLAVQTSIKTCRSEVPVMIYRDEEDFFVVFKKAWNWFCNLIQKPQMMIIIDNTIFAVLISIGVPPAAAKLLSTGISTINTNKNNTTYV